MNNGKRLGIFFFYDKDGIVDNYIDYLLKGMSDVIDELVVVVNGILSTEGKMLFSRYSSNTIIRDNTGMDAWAYKKALENVGWNVLRKYHEVVLFNYTIMGPLYPFADMFNEMAKRKDIDFWGINEWRPDFYGGEIDNFCNNPFGYVPRHIQSHFMVYRNHFLQAKELEEYWKHLPHIDSYIDSIGKHESYFTKHFEDLGFKSSVYVNSNADYVDGPYLLFDNPIKAIDEYKCPIFKRKSFFYSPTYYLIDTLLDEPRDLLEHVQKLGYPKEYILQNIMRTNQQKNAALDMSLNKVFDIKIPCSSYDDICLIYYSDKNDGFNDNHYLFNYCGALKRFLITKNRLFKFDGKEFSKYKSGINAIFTENKYICFINLEKIKKHSKKLSNSLNRMVHESLLGNVEKVRDSFEDDECLGIMCLNEQPFLDNFSNIGNSKIQNEYSSDEFSIVYGSFWVRSSILVKNKETWIKEALTNKCNEILIETQKSGYYCCTVSTINNVILRANAYEKMIGELNIDIKKFTGINDYSFNYFINLNQFKTNANNQQRLNKENEIGIERYIKIAEKLPLSFKETFEIRINSVFPFLFRNINENKKIIYKNYGIKFAIKVILCRFILNLGKGKNNNA